MSSAFFNQLETRVLLSKGGSKTPEPKPLPAHLHDERDAIIADLKQLNANVAANKAKLAEARKALDAAEDKHGAKMSSLAKAVEKAAKALKNADKAAKAHRAELLEKWAQIIETDQELIDTLTGDSTDDTDDTTDGGDDLNPNDGDDDVTPTVEHNGDETDEPTGDDSDDTDDTDVPTDGGDDVDPTPTMTLDEAKAKLAADLEMRDAELYEAQVQAQLTREPLVAALQTAQTAFDAAKKNANKVKKNCQEAVRSAEKSLKDVFQSDVKILERHIKDFKKEGGDKKWLSLPQLPKI